MSTRPRLPQPVVPSFWHLYPPDKPIPRPWPQMPPLVQQQIAQQIALLLRRIRHSDRYLQEGPHGEPHTFD